MAAPKFTEMVELMLARAYELRDEGDYGIDFLAIGAELGGTEEKVWRATEVLEDRGLIECARELGPGCTGHLSGEGLLFVEGGGSTGVIEKFLEHRSVYIINSPGASVGDHKETNSVNVGRDVVNSAINVGSGSAQGSPNWMAVRAAMEDLRTIAKDLNVAPEVAAEIAGDVDTALAQVSKAKPNVSVVRLALSSVLSTLDTFDKAGGTLAFVEKVQAAIAQMGNFV